MSFRALPMRGAWLLLLLPAVTGFAPLISSGRSSSSTTVLSASVNPRVVVVSPPGGIGEAAAVGAASNGASVRWFVVAEPPNPDDVVAMANKNQNVPQSLVLSRPALESMQAAGGTVELAGAEASSLLLPPGDEGSAVSAVATWCGTADAVVCTYDGVDQLKISKEKVQKAQRAVWMNAIKVAARQAAQNVGGTKVAILSSEEAIVTGKAQEGEEEEEEKSSGGGGLGGLVGSLLGGKVDIPETLLDAMASDSSSSKPLILRYGELFGIPESSPDFSPLVGGPRKVPEYCEEYTLRSVRIDPTLSVAGNVLVGSSTRSSRNAVGTAAALMALQQVPTTVENQPQQQQLDVSLTSLPGIEPVPLKGWQDEFARVRDLLAQGKAAQLFTSDLVVSDVSRLTTWFATKWAPTVLRTYDLAAIRTGARPVYALQPSSDDDDDDSDEIQTVEIVWQQLVNYETATVGKLILQVSPTGIEAVRGPGDPTKGFGEIPRRPLPGEDVLVRFLAQAAAQAVEKGLAEKPVAAAVPVVPVPQPVATTTPAAPAAAAATPPPPPPSSSSAATGPRQAGARRSTQRARGTRRKAPPTSSNESS